MPVCMHVSLVKRHKSDVSCPSNVFVWWKRGGRGGGLRETRSFLFSYGSLDLPSGSRVVTHTGLDYRALNREANKSYTNCLVAFLWDLEATTPAACCFHGEATPSSLRPGWERSPKNSYDPQELDKHERCRLKIPSILSREFIWESPKKWGSDTMLALCSVKSRWWIDQVIL